MNEQRRTEHPSVLTEIKKHGTKDSDYYGEEIMTMYGVGVTWGERIID